MPELIFKGKEFVYNHHLSVPFRPLAPEIDRSIVPTGEPVRLDGNIVVYGDNLHALKALLPMYAGKVDCVFIDPPYNTGNESWNYNDNVNSPLMREWLSSNPVGLEDGLRHDKWLCMMYPRLKLLRELLSDNGSFWMTLDDNEVHRARGILDEIFGEENFVTQVEWQKRYTRSNNTNNFTSVIDHLIVYRKSELFEVNLLEREDEANARYSNPDNDPRGPWKAIPFLNPAPPDKRPNLCYPITNPNTGQTTLAKEKAWRNERTVFERLLKEKRLWWGKDGRRPVPDIKRFLSEVKQGIAPINFWPHEFAGDTDEANLEIKTIFGDKVFDTPKPVRLIQRVLEHATSKDSIVLDSFAGSGTTAHAVLAANKKDGGSRRFILVESEEYADRLTAERVRRVIRGYDFKGTEREELLREPLTFSNLKAADKLLKSIAGIENLEGYRFDRIRKEIKDGTLVVSGEKVIAGRAEGLGGTFTYCSLGDPLDLDAILTGSTLPEFGQLGAWLFHTATNEAFDPSQMDPKQFYLGESSSLHVWLIYRPDLEFLKSRESALTLARAKEIADKSPPQQTGKRHLVFAPARFAANKHLLPLGVEHAPLPFALFKIER